MGSWYWIGVSVGLGAAYGVVNGGFLGIFWGGLVERAVVALLGGAGMGLFINALHAGLLWSDLTSGALAALLTFLGTAQIAAGALRRGGTRSGTATLVSGAGLIAAGIAFIPAAGYLVAVALPTIALRLRRTQPERYAGLRTLAKD